MDSRVPARWTTTAPPIRRTRPQARDVALAASAGEREGSRRRARRPGAAWILVVALLYGVVAFAGIAHGASGLVAALGIILVLSSVAPLVLGETDSRNAGARPAK